MKTEDFNLAFRGNGFSEEQNKQITESALTVASQILISAVVMTGAKNYIVGDVNFPDGTAWELHFKRKQPISKTLTNPPNE